jgi:putative polymerase
MISSAAHRSGYGAGRDTETYPAADATAAGYAPVALVLLAALFNAGLALINARVKPLTGNTVILCEVLIVAASHLYILRHFQTRMVNWYFLALAFAVFAILRISVTDNLDAKYFRDIFVIITFVLLGMTSTQHRAIQMMAVLQVAVILGILLEAACIECYSDVFAVKDFYISTRGLSETDFTNLSSDLYVSATRPEARFMPFFDLHRLSSIFLEPVSLGNFMIMTAGFTAAFWNQMSTGLRAFFVASATLMLFACDGRLAALATVAIIAMTVGHRFLPRHTGLLFLPAVAALAIFVTSTAGLKSGTDDLTGRVAYTAEILSGLSLYDFAGWSDSLLERSVDAGLVYLIITQSLLGVAIIWTFITLSAGESSPEQKIYKNSLLLYLALTMMVSYSFVSIKTAAPIWFIFGALLAMPAQVDDENWESDGSSEP